MHKFSPFGLTSCTQENKHTDMPGLHIFAFLPLAEGAMNSGQTVPGQLSHTR